MLFNSVKDVIEILGYDIEQDLFPKEEIGLPLSINLQILDHFQYFRNETTTEDKKF